MLITVWCLYIAARSIARESKYKFVAVAVEGGARRGGGWGCLCLRLLQGTAVDDTSFVFWVSVSYKLVAFSSAVHLDVGSREVGFKAIYV